MPPKKGKQLPSRSVVLPHKTSKYKEAVRIYEESGRKCQRWQALLLKDIMGRNKDGLWTHVKFGCSVPRRNGKNEVIVMREMWGLKHGERICHTAHRTSTSHSAWERLVKVLTEAGYIELGRRTQDEVPVPNSFRTSKKYGLETVEFTDGGSIVFRTRTESGGLGEGYDLLIIDEAQEYTEPQESTLVYTVSDSTNPQTIFCGTPNTMVSSGTVFSKMRDEVFKGNLVDSGWAEWGVDTEPTDIMDKSLWYLTNPSLGTILTERKIQAEIRGDKLDFIIQRLGYWYKYSLKSAISAAEWDIRKCDALPELSGQLCVAIKHGREFGNVSMSLAVRTEDGNILVEAIDCRPLRDGYSWIIAFLKKCKACGEVYVDGAAIQNEISEGMKAVGLKAPVFPTVGNVIESCSFFEQALFIGKICHMGQPSLRNSVTNCEHRPIGSAGGFGYKSINEKYDVSLLESSALAAWGVTRIRQKRKQEARY